MCVEKNTPMEPDSLREEVATGADDLSRLPERIARYSIAKKRSLEMSSYIQSLSSDGDITLPKDLLKLASQVKDCASYLLFRNYHTVSKVRLSKAFFCKKHLLCPMCAIRRGAKTLKAYMERYEIITKAEPDLKLYMMTLTVKNGTDLKERFEHLQKSFKTYVERRRDYFKKGRGFNQLCKAEGAVYSYEVTNKKNGWHPHIHILLLLRPNEKINKFELSTEWKNITKDSKIVDVRPVRGEPVSGFMEVLKYAMKFSDLTTEQNFEAFKILTGKRMIGSFGNFRGIKVSKDYLDDDLENLPYTELLYNYFQGIGYSVTDHGYITKESQLNKITQFYKSDGFEVINTYSSDSIDQKLLV